ncbi:hypothetical protein [Pontimicrobium sp. MEBiC06410]
MNRILSILFFTITYFSFGQINTSKFKCGEEFRINYNTTSENTIKLEFLWNTKEELDIGVAILPNLVDGNGNINKGELIKIISNEKGLKIPLSELNDNFKFKGAGRSKIEYSIKRSYVKNNITDYKNDKFITSLHATLDNLTGGKICSEGTFKPAFINELNYLKENILINSTQEPFFNNKEIIELPSGKRKIPKTKYMYDADIRNPIAFTEFLVRNPRVNGKSTLVKPDNLASYHYIRPGSLINIIFNKSVYQKLEGVELTIKAFLKRKNGTVVPINVSGFYEVKEETNKSAFEKNTLKEAKGKENLDYNYEITITKNSPIQTEVNTSVENPLPEDKLIITVSNVSDGGVSLTMTFEYEDYGWETSASGGFSWVNSRGQTNNFRPAGSSGVSFHYKLNKGANFGWNFINPSFGPELIVLQNENSTSTNVGLGLSVSTFLRTVKVGYGWYLTGDNGKPYFSVGVNFVEGYKSLSTILARSKE